ncbi:hypothetical protein [Rasiella sp. SM2506]|uniref:hypothetical protein n=1 Tax=Rasiella sp. SM2506 TaxID=3423914 RepID=UPI003D7B5586
MQTRYAQAKKNIVNRFIIWTLLLFTNITIAQSDKQFLSDFLLEDELKSGNQHQELKQYDFSNIWKNTPNEIIYGIIGEDHQRIRVKLLSINKSFDNPNVYDVYGKSMVKGTVCDFFGTITIKKIKEVTELHFGVDNEYKNKGIKKQGIIIAEYSFNEDAQQKHSGIFKGKLFSKWYLNKKDEMEYDDIQSISDSYKNNAFIGIWKSYSTGKEKICNWADWRVPNANQDFDIGAGEFSVSEKYWNKGWMDIALKNQVPNGAIVREKSNKKTKEWWE